MISGMRILILRGSQGVGPEFGKASPWGLFFLLVIFAALIFLLVSMSKHLKRAQKNFTHYEMDTSISSQKIHPTPENDISELDVLSTKKEQNEFNSSDEFSSSSEIS